jgi:diguanylate cyclase (GGDEF)-like protein
VISVQRADALAFDEQDEKMLAALASQTAMALQNARLHQVAQDQAKLDSLTQVYNHGHFVHLVRAAIDQADAAGSQVALIMLDIDYFKHYNDTFIAHCLKESTDPAHAVGRWGGEEFGILLPDCDIAEAKRLCRLISRSIAALVPVDGQGEQIIPPTVSQGISSYPYPSTEATELIDHADAALYHAKKKGRNQLVVYEAPGVLIEASIMTGSLLSGMPGGQDSTNPNLALDSRPREYSTNPNLS